MGSMRNIVYDDESLSEGRESFMVPRHGMDEDVSSSVSKS